jgi:hypothetical protein
MNETEELIAVEQAALSPWGKASARETVIALHLLRRLAATLEVDVGDVTVEDILTYFACRDRAVFGDSISFAE